MVTQNPEEPIRAASGDLDIFGATPPTARASAMAEVGSALPGAGDGSRYGDTIPALRGTRKIRAYSEMREQSSVVGAMMMAVRMIMRGVKWNAELPEEAEEDDTEANKARDFLTTAMKDMSHTWAEFIDDSLDATWAGFAAPEIVYKQRLGMDEDPGSEYDDGLIGWRKIAYRDPAGVVRWKVDPSGGIQGYWHQVQQLPEVFIPIEKVILFRASRKGNDPEGYSWLHNSYVDWTYMRKHLWLEAVGVERQGLGLPVVTLPLGADISANSQDLIRAQNLVRAIRQDAYMGVVLPPALGKEEHQKWNLDLMSAGTGGVATTDVIIRRYALNIASSILAHFIALGQQARGSYALSSDQRDLWQLAMRGLSELWAELMNRHLVRPLFRLNQASFPDHSKWPRVQPSDVAQHDIEKVQKYIVALVGGGVMNVDADDRNRLRQLVGFPPETRAQKEEMNEKAKQAPPPPPGKKPKGDDDDDGALSAVETLVGRPVSEWVAEDAWMAAMTLEEEA